MSPVLAGRFLSSVPLLLLLLLSRFSRVQLCATHRRQPTWVSPGKNTGVGCHFLLQCMKVKSESEVTQSCPTLSNPMDCSLPGSSIHGIFQAGVVEWGAIAFSEHDCYHLLSPGNRLDTYSLLFYTCLGSLSNSPKVVNERYMI